MTDDAPLTEEEELILKLMDQQEQGKAIADEDIPEQYHRDPKFMKLLDRIRQLDSLAMPGHQRPSPPTSESSLSQQLPREFGPYTLIEELGRGGMGVVYRGEHRTLKTDFAVKMIRTSEFASEEEIRRFFQEARAASKMKHPNIVDVHDAGELDGLPFLVMRYVAGETLADRLKHETYTLEEGVELLRKISNAVDYLHSQSIIHRDLKPSNILLDANGEPFITDFGLAKVFDMDAERTATGTVIGTPAYMSPEQAWGRPEDVSEQSDIYSLGAMLYELLTGKAPFAGLGPLDQLLQLRDVDPPPPRTLNRTIPYELEQICLRCLEKDPSHRYHNAKDFAADLERFQHAEPITLPGLGLWQKVRRWVRREPALVSHWSAFAIIALIVQVANLTAGERRTPYLPVMSVLLLWTAVAFILQKLLHRNITSARLIWIAVDAALFTAAVSYAEGPIESLVIGYSLLIAASSMWFQPQLVSLMTAVCVAAYIVLIGLRGADETPVHYHFIVVGILTVIGVIISALVDRIRMLLRVRSIGNE